MTFKRPTEVRDTLEATRISGGPGVQVTMPERFSVVVPNSHAHSGAKHAIITARDIDEARALFALSKNTWVAVPFNVDNRLGRWATTYWLR